MSDRLLMKVAKAMYEASPAGDCPLWEDADDHVRDWLISRARAAIEAVDADLSQFVKRNLIEEAAATGKMLIARLRG